MKKYIKNNKIILSLILFFFICVYGKVYIVKNKANDKYLRKVYLKVWKGSQSIANLMTEKNKLKKILEKQKNIERQIEKEYSELEYTWSQPYIKINPYGTTPLSALIKFKTDEPMKVEIEIVDREGSNVIYNFEKYTTEHEYSISGLYLRGKTEVILNLETIEKNKRKKNPKL